MGKTQTERWATAWIAALALLAVPAVVSAAVPVTVQVQGALLNNSGGPGSDGAYLLTFSLYHGKDAKTATWSESAKIGVTAGRFHHALGSLKPLASKLLDSKLPMYFGVAVDNDAELPRTPLNSALFARRSEVAEALACSGCVTAAHLAKGAIGKDAVSFKYAASDTVGGAASDVSCTGCVSVAEMKFDGDVNLGSKSLKASKVSADSVVAKTVAAGSFVGNGSQMTDVKVKGGVCKSGEVVRGVNTDGSVKCATAAGDDKTALGDMLTRVFSETATAAGLPKSIPDNTGKNLVVEALFGDVGDAVSVQTKITLSNTDLSKVKLTLVPPDGKTLVICDPCGNKDEKAYDKVITATTALKTGTLAAYVGTNAKGKWTLSVSDSGFCLPQLQGNNSLCDSTNKLDGKLQTFVVALDVKSNQSIATKGTMGVGVFGAPPFVCTLARQGHVYFDKNLLLLRFCDGYNWRESLPTTLCGNKIANIGETCDDGNTKDGDGCTSSCQKNVCGDGIVHVGVEECDDKNKKDGDGCSAKCAAEFTFKGASFSTCGSSGRNGPSQSQCDTSYKGSSLQGNVTLATGIQSWTVPATTTYRIEAWGARSGYENKKGVAFAGKGIGLAGDFALTKGTVLKILVGQVAMNNTSSSAGGGGGTFIATSTNQALLVAGGGGGHEGTPRSNKQDAASGTSGQPGGGTCQNWNGGTGGKGATHNTGGNTGGGGGGFTTDGGQGNLGGKGGKGFLNGGAGGATHQNNVVGGFGGGGGAYGNGGGAGGGGGYSGGGMGDNCTGATGGGGGSFNSGQNKAVVGHHSAAGKVTIKLK